MKPRTILTNDVRRQRTGSVQDIRSSSTLDTCSCADHQCQTARNLTKILERTILAINGVARPPRRRRRRFHRRGRKKNSLRLCVEDCDASLERHSLNKMLPEERTVSPPSGQVTNQHELAVKPTSLQTVGRAVNAADHKSTEKFKNSINFRIHQLRSKVSRNDVMRRTRHEDAINADSNKCYADTSIKRKNETIVEKSIGVKRHQLHDSATSLQRERGVQEKKNEQKNGINEERFPQSSSGLALRKCRNYRISNSSSHKDSSITKSPIIANVHKETRHQLQKEHSASTSDDISSDDCSSGDDMDGSTKAQSEAKPIPFPQAGCARVSRDLYSSIVTGCPLPARIPSTESTPVEVPKQMNASVCMLPTVSSSSAASGTPLNSALARITASPPLPMDQRFRRRRRVVHSPPSSYRPIAEELTNASPTLVTKESSRLASQSNSSHHHTDSDSDTCSSPQSHRSRCRSHSRSRSRSSWSRGSSSDERSDWSTRSSRSPSIPVRRGSPSFMERRRITSARKRPIQYKRATSASSETSSCESDDSYDIGRRCSRSPTHTPSPIREARRNLRLQMNKSSTPSPERQRHHRFSHL